MIGDREGIGLRGLGAQLLAERRPAGEGVRDFAERVLDRALVLRDGDVAIDAGDVEVGLVTTSVEDRLQKLCRAR